MNPKIHPFSAAAYPLSETGVSFSCTDEEWILRDGAPVLSGKIPFGGKV